MAKILVHICLKNGDKFFEINNLNRVWMNRNNVYGAWALMYSDDKYEYNTIFYDYSYNEVEKARKKLVEAYKNGQKVVSL